MSSKASSVSSGGDTAAQADDVEIPAVWVKTKLPDDEGGHEYFYHAQTRECSYSPPPEGEKVCTQEEFDALVDGDAEGDEDEADEIVLTRDTIDDWKFITDEDGDSFWYNSKTNKSMWDNPHELLAR